MRLAQDAIFFWEGVSATPEILDQYSVGLEISGFLDRVTAMVVGQTLYEENDRRNRPIRDLLREYGERFGIPVVKMESFGHSITENPPIPIGAQVQLDTFRKKFG